MAENKYACAGFYAGDSVTIILLSSTKTEIRNMNIPCANKTAAESKSSQIGHLRQIEKTSFGSKNYKFIRLYGWYLRIFVLIWAHLYYVCYCDYFISYYFMCIYFWFYMFSPLEACNNVLWHTPYAISM